MRYARICILLFLSAILVPAAIAGADGGPERFLPVSSCPEGWGRDGQVALFDKESLFDRINGESELYFPYGFTALAYARYASAKDARYAIDADVYVMGSPIDAFGIFANYRRKDSGEVPLGDGGIASPSQVLFHQDRYFVRLQATGTATLDQDLLTACAMAIAKNLPRGGGRPKELDVLNVPGVQRTSLRYLSGNLLGYEFLGRGMIADAGAEGEAGQVFYAPQDSPGSSGASFERYRDYLKRSGSEVRMEPRKEGRSLVAVDPLYGNVLVQQTARGLIGAVKYRDRRAADRVLEQVRVRLETGK